MKTVALGLLSAVLLASCAQTKFKPWVGAGVEKGSGGACEQVNGVDVWSYGRPNRRYQMIGIIEDTRPGGIIPMAQRNATIAKEAKRHGGDAVIVMAENREVAGMIHTLNSRSHTTLNSQWTGFQHGDFVRLNGTGTATTNTFGTGYSMPAIRAFGQYQVIKYIR